MDNFCASYKFVRIGPHSLLKTEIFGEKGYPANGKDFTPTFFFVFIEFDNPQETNSKCPRYFGKHCGSYKIISLGPKRSSEKLFNKGLYSP